MLRLPSRAAAGVVQSSLAPARTLVRRRFLSTQPPHLKSRSWKNSAARWGIAIAGIYFYTTSPIFAAEPSNNLLNPNLDKVEEEAAGTSLEALTSPKRRQQSKEAQVLASAAEVASTENASTTADPNAAPSVQALEEEADEQGAFNPETGEINWDCPCLGGMAHGPCGPQFREAFSCFVYSTQEPKGMDCIEKFQGMQECFKEHPDVYKAELDEDEDNGEYDEALAAEKEELVKEIKERREKAGIEADGSQRRLLEEAPAPPREPKPKVKSKTKNEKASPSSTPADSSSKSTDAPATNTKVSSGSSSLEPETVKESQKSFTVTDATTPQVRDASPGLN